MKTLSKTLFVALLGMCFFTSCATTDESNEFNYESFKEKIQSDQLYTDYIVSQSNFLTHVAEGCFDLYTITSIFEENQISDFCSADPILLESIEDAELFLNSHCKVKTNLNQLNSIYKDISNLTESEFTAIMITPALPETNQIQTRAINCMAVYTSAYYSASNSCLELQSYGNSIAINADCHDMGVSAGSSAHDDCCQGNNDGC